MVGIGGDYADYQYMANRIETVFGPKAIHSWLTNFLYTRRSKMNPLWNVYIVGGFEDDTNEPYLGTVNLLGVSYTNPYVATGLGSYLVQVTRHCFLSTAWKFCSSGTALLLISYVPHVGRVSYIACFQYEIGIVNQSECKIIKPKPVVGKWEIAQMVRYVYKYSFS
ncbi:unnamed protein product [Soboliphyme baturini]|uniref:Copine domain-containing protein n=1 Tax=Soboliphyme baturini TaxID=241478 RepID=A0A183IB30_9BILA|nr:unnamed protein product [Soboliphyme baturini]